METHTAHVVTQYEEKQLCDYVHLTMINHSKISVIVLLSRRLFGIRHHQQQQQCEGVHSLCTLTLTSKQF